MEQRIVLALDGITREHALAVAKELQGRVWGFKVNDLLVRYGVSIISELKAFGKVFADPKFYDIPNTIHNSCKVISDAGADLITVHASAGLRGLLAARDGAGSAGILAVTVLTSFGADEFQAIYHSQIADGVMNLAKLAAEAQIFGLVCSPEEVSKVRNCSELSSLKLVVPGVRPSWYNKADDQKRVAEPRYVCKSGADLLVIGRPILDDRSPLHALERINAEMGNDGLS